MNKPTLLVLAAGMGSRYGGLKQLDPMGPSGETLLDYSVFDALRAGFGDVVFVIRREFEESFQDLVAARYRGHTNITFAYQDLSDLPEGRIAPEGRIKPWGTTHAIWAARHHVTRPFLAINADDFYGAEAYRLLADHLSKAGEKECAMAGYSLGTTLSEHGSVSRGVCRVDPHGWLSEIEEFTQIQKTTQGAAHFGPDGRVAQFSGHELVSMNFWGFTPAIFPLLGNSLASFLDLRGSDLESECYIPASVGESVASGSIRVKVLETSSEWFGITYRDDKPLVQNRLAERVRDAHYPSPLWKA